MTRNMSGRQEAAGLLAAIFAIRRELRRETANGAELAQMVLQLQRLLLAYFERQERELLPLLAASASAVTVMTGREFAAELVDLRTMCPPYFGNWSKAGAIDAQFDGFRYESDLVLGAMQSRLQREGTQLYPLLEAEVRLRAA